MDSSHDLSICNVVLAVAALCVSLAAATLLDPSHLFTATLPLAAAGLFLGVLAYDERFQKFVTTGV